jgi:hypothetical protein
MKKLNHKIVTLFLILFTFINSLQLFAQKSPSELSIYGGGGLSLFCYKAPMSKTTSLGYNWDIGVGFTTFMSEQWGFHLGLGVGQFNINNRVGDLDNPEIPRLIDSDGHPYDLYSTLSGYKETHKLLFMELPLMFQFQTRIKNAGVWKKSQKQSFYAMAGVKLLLLFKRDYEAQVTTLYNKAYYPEVDNWAATQTFVGLGKFPGNNTDSKFGVGAIFAVTLETGIKWRLLPNLNLYTGVFWDCGLNDPSKKLRKEVGNFTSPESLEKLSLLSFYKNAFLMNVGIKLRFAFILPPKFTSCY